MSLGKNASLTMAAAVVQIGLTLATLPLYLSAIGLDRFGVVVFLWLVFDYFLLFNLGLDRAAVNLLSRYRLELRRMADVFWTAMAVCLLSAVIGAAVLYYCLPYITLHLLSPEASLFGEIRAGYAAFAVLLVFTLLGSVVSALLQAQDRFLEINASQILMSAAFQIGPVLAALVIAPTLEVVLIAGCLARGMQTLINILLCFRPKYRIGNAAFSRTEVSSLMKFGLWANVTGIISPIVVNLDRVLVGALSGPAAVALYVLPYNLVMKALMIPTSLSSALFPKLSRSVEPIEHERTVENALYSLVLVLTLGLLAGSFLLEPFLNIWVRKFVSPEAIVVGQILIFGIWFNGLAMIPFTWLQASGRPDIVAKIHAAEVIPFIVTLWLLVSKFGIIGASIAWTARVIADALILFYLSRRLLPPIKNIFKPLLYIGCCVAFNCLPSRAPSLSITVFAFLNCVTVLWAVKNAPAEILDRVAAILHRATGYKLRKPKT